MSRRELLADFNSISHFITKLKTAKKIVVITGAGISVSCGIPDFRSDNGLYKTLNLAQYNIPSAELLFDLKYFMVDAVPFYKFASVLAPNDCIKPSRTHYFIRALQDKKKLLRYIYQFQLIKIYLIIKIYFFLSLN